MLPRLTVLVLCLLCWHCAEVAAVANDEDFFRESVEPILRERCYECHSHSAGEISSGLTLDWKSGWETGGDRGPAVIPGDPESSLLIQAVRHSDPELKMPDEKLSDDEIAILTEWVKRGAVDPRVLQPQPRDPAEATNWWSLRPLNRPDVTEGQHPIDAFLLAELKQKGLTFSKEADRVTLIRRLSIDLHGLHPTVEEVEAFVRDERPDAFEQLVDRMLESPRYGERWARHWLDTIHFADTHGFEHDALRPNAWRFRDYVIESLNQDKPWDRFIREQLAADVFYPGETRLTVALGFLGAGTYDHSAAATAINSFEYLDRDDLVTQTMAAFASTTVNCARCHSHKFDPVTQEDYYALQAVFAGIGKGDITFDEDPAVAERRQRWQLLQTAATGMDQTVLLQPENEALVTAWESQRGPAANWQPLDITGFVSTGSASLIRNADGSILAGGTRPDTDITSITCTTPLKSITAFRLDVLTDPSLPMNGPGRMDNGNLHLTEFEVQEFVPGEAAPRLLKFAKATADFDQVGWTSSHAIDGDPATAWGIHPKVGESHSAVFELNPPREVTPGTTFVILLKQLHGRGHLIGRFALSVTDSAAELTAAIPGDVQDVLRLEQDQRNPEQRATLAAFVIQRVADEQLQALPAPAKVYAAGPRAENERGVITIAEPRTIRILRRGDLDKPGAEVKPGALSAVSFGVPSRFEFGEEMRKESLRRAALADWLAHHDNPLTWRSIVNRVWQFHFGKGISETPSDFGRMGGLPSHPELLDWLAVWFRDDAKGSLKQLHRLIVTSSAWRQASADRPEYAAIDSENRLLWKMNRSRLDADCLRDAVMVASGQLDLTMGGPGVAHFLSSPGPQLTPVLDYESFDWNTAGANRRSIYRVVWRGIQDPFMEAFDFPDMGQLSATRGFSGSPLQSLVLWNNHFILHHAQKMSARVKAHSTLLPEQITAVVKICWLRNPTPEEHQLLEKLATEFGLPAVCRLLLNSNEFLFVE